MSAYYDIPENYLNPPEAAKSEPQKNNLDMYAFIAELNRAKSNVEPIFDGMLKIMGGTK